jgi:hypothetical protein
MKVPFNILDFLDRAEHVYGDRIGVVDEPDQPADSWGQLTWRQVAEHARAMAAGLDGRTQHRRWRRRRRCGRRPPQGRGDKRQVRGDVPALLGQREGGKIFCLVEADSAADAHAVHREAHGLVVDAIYEVEQG